MDENESQHTESADRNELLDQYQRDTALATEKWKPALKRIQKNRRLMRGGVPGGDGGDDAEKEEKVRANIIYSTVRSILPHIYAQHPEVSCRPSAQAGTRGQLYEFAKGFGETLEIMINHELVKGKFKKKHKRLLRSAQTSRIGLVKVSFQRDFYTDPMIHDRLQDAQDNLNELTGRIKQLEEESLSAEQEQAQAEELMDLIESLNESVEVMRSQGTVFDPLNVNDFLMDPSVDSLEDYTHATWMQDRTWMPVETFKRSFNKLDDDLTDLTIYHRPDGGATNSGWKAGDKEKGHQKGWVAIWERWNKNTNTVYTWADGADDWLREPFQPKKTSERWFPYFLFGLHWIDGESWPLSDVELLEKLADEYNSTREMQAEHRAAAVPYLVAAGSALSPNDVNKIELANGLEIVVLDIEGKNIRDLVQDGPVPTFNPAMYDTQGIHQDIGLVSGASDASKGAIMSNKTLGEAEILQQHLATRLGDMQDESEEFINEIAEHIAEIILQEYTPEEVMRIAGQNAVWPDMDKWEIFNLVDVEIRAGSTGKPDKARDMQQWSEMLPLMLQLIQLGLQYRMQGGGIDPMTQQPRPVDDSSNPFFNILEVSFKKFDERMDMESILPPQQTQEQMLPQGGVVQPQQPIM